MVNTNRFGTSGRRPGRSRKSGLPPGTLVHIGEVRTEKVHIEVFRYNAERVERIEIRAPADLDRLSPFEGVTWINVCGVHDPEIIAAIGHRYALHPLALEDVLNTEQRPKVDPYPNFVYIVLKIMRLESEAGGRGLTLDVEQISLFLTNQTVITFQERFGDAFDGVRRRIEEGRPNLRGRGPDYLVYALVDAVVDGYFIVLEQLGETIEAVEDCLIQGKLEEAFPELQHLRRMMLVIRRSVWPLREVINTLMRDDNEWMKPETQLYLRDVYDHTIHILDTVETYRELVAGLVDLYLNAVSNRLNEIMKVLTIIATIFIPLTFITGVYGMNFRSMPELSWRWGYIAVWGVMLFIAVGLLIYFRRRRWL